MSKSAAESSRFANRLVRALAVLVALLGAGVVILLFLLHREQKIALLLPVPTGPFAVGRSSYAWINPAQTDDLAPSPQTKRLVLTWIWYPAAPTPSAIPAAYLPSPWRAAEERYSGPLMRFLTRDASLTYAHSFSDPAVSPQQPSYPVVVMRAGGGALTLDYTSLAEDLASHGYIVVGFDAPYRTSFVVLPDGRVVERPPADNPENLSGPDLDRLADKLLAMWTSDTKFVVDQLAQLNGADPSGRFTGRLDMQHLGMFGHSFGGATALEFCHEDSRCKAAIDIDGNPFGSVVQQGLAQPLLFLLSDHGDLSGTEERAVFAKIRSIHERSPGAKLCLALRGANHFSFSDQILRKSQYLISLLEFVRFGFHGLAPRRGLAITSDYVHTFFDIHLKNAPPSALDGLSRTYPEVRPLLQ